MVFNDRVVEVKKPKTTVTAASEKKEEPKRKKAKENAEAKEDV